MSTLLGHPHMTPPLPAAARADDLAHTTLLLLLLMLQNLIDRSALDAAANLLLTAALRAARWRRLGDVELPDPVPEPKDRRRREAGRG